MNLTQNQRAICRELTALSYENGFGSAYPLRPIADKLGLPHGKWLYDADTETGMLWPLGDYGEGLLSVEDSGLWASVCFDTHVELEHWSREPLNTETSK